MIKETLLFRHFECSFIIMDWSELTKFKHTQNLLYNTHTHTYDTYFRKKDSLIIFHLSIRSVREL